MYRIAIIDDDVAYAQRLRENLKELNSDYSFEVLNMIQNFDKGYDAIFLDIELDGMGITGFEFANKIAEYRLPIIFMTSHKDYALDGYAYQPFDFIWKAEIDKRLPQILNRLQASLDKRNLKLNVVDEDDFEISIAIAEIIYIKKDRNYIFIKGKQMYHKRCSIKQIDSKLHELGINSFLSPMQGYLVNCNNIKEVRRAEYSVLMIDGSVIPLGTKKVSEFLLAKAKIQSDLL